MSEGILEKTKCRPCGGRGVYDATENDPRNPSPKKRHQYLCGQCKGHGILWRIRYEYEGGV